MGIGFGVQYKLISWRRRTLSDGVDELMVVQRGGEVIRGVNAELAEGEMFDHQLWMFWMRVYSTVVSCLHESKTNLEAYY